ncbi:MAG: hypothetical protein ACJ8AI_31075 [Rhodopila sp.]
MRQHLVEAGPPPVRLIADNRRRGRLEAFGFGNRQRDEIVRLRPDHVHGNRLNPTLGQDVGQVRHLGQQRRQQGVAATEVDDGVQLLFHRGLQQVAQPVLRIVSVR